MNPVKINSWAYGNRFRIDTADDLTEHELKMIREYVTSVLTGEPPVVHDECDSEAKKERRNE